MPNFQPIAWVDPFDLAASLRTRMGLFKPGGEGPLTLAVRGPLPGPENDPAGLAYYKAAGVRSGKWPEMKIVLDQIKRLGEQQGGVELGRIGLEMLPAGACSPWTWTGVPNDFEHGRLLLRGNPGLVWYGGAETWIPTIGVLTLVNWRVPNSAVNMGESPAVWLAVDFRKAGEP
jgi:hypothetical protein